MKQYKRRLREKCKQIVNACNECKSALREVELSPHCTDCSSFHRCELAKEILEELNA